MRKVVWRIAVVGLLVIGCSSQRGKESIERQASEEAPLLRAAPTCVDPPLDPSAYAVSPGGPSTCAQPGINIALEKGTSCPRIPYGGALLRPIWTGLTDGGYPLCEYETPATPAPGPPPAGYCSYDTLPGEIGWQYSCCVPPDAGTGPGKQTESKGPCSVCYCPICQM
jgi:hypothetical protein